MIRIRIFSTKIDLLFFTTSLSHKYQSLTLIFIKYYKIVDENINTNKRYAIFVYWLK